MWANLESLHGVSQALMWASGLLALLAALSTGARYYVDRRAEQLTQMEAQAEVATDALAARKQHAIRLLQEKIARAEQAQVDLATSAPPPPPSPALVAEEPSAPRTITTTQRAKFIALLQNAPKGRVTVGSFLKADAATIRFAGQIREMVMAAGYDSGITVAMSLGSGSVPEGLRIAMRSEQERPPFAEAVQRAFAETGLPLPGIRDPTIAPDEVMIIVGIDPELE